MKLRSVLNVVEKWRQVISLIPRIGHVEEAGGVLDGMEESLHTNVRIVVMWSSILRSREMKKSYNRTKRTYQYHKSNRCKNMLGL